FGSRSREPELNPSWLLPQPEENPMHRHIAIIAAVAFPAVAHATDASAGVRISLNVPEICQIEAPILAVDASQGSATGTVFEMCNSARAFRVMASHRELAEGEHVQVHYAGQFSKLERSGLSDIAY